jgi:hypothetical protein
MTAYFSFSSWPLFEEEEGDRGYGGRGHRDGDQEDGGDPEEEG